MTTRVIVLDFDGVVVESNQIKHQAFSDLFSNYPEFYDQIMVYHRSHNAVDRHEKFRYIMEHIMHQPYSKECAGIWALEYAIMTRQKIIQSPFVNGAPELINDLRRFFPIFLASATPLDELRIILEARGIAGLFKEVYGAPMKKILVFEDIARKEMVKPDEILFVGDSHEDYLAAKQFGCRFIGRIDEYDFNDVKTERFNDLHEIKTYIIKNLMNGGCNGLSDTTIQA
jgi:phosphoglycolate phosphatase-like HAD superfamily hydrolase